MYTECIVPDEGHRNSDGYVRVLDKPRREGGKLCMLHRMEWEKHFGPIPDGLEINHKCGNRECANIKHLEVLPKTQHRRKDNSLRYADRAARVLVYSLSNPNLTQKEVASVFGITQPSVSVILRRELVWKFR